MPTLAVRSLNTSRPRAASSRARLLGDAQLLAQHGRQQFQAMPTSVSYSRHGAAQGAVYEHHRQAEREYTAVRDFVKAAAQRQLDDALEKVQTAPHSRDLCLSDMYVRPNSAASVTEKLTTRDINISPVAGEGEQNPRTTELKQRYTSESDFGSGYRNKDGRPLTSDDLLPAKNRPVFLPNFKPLSAMNSLYDSDQEMNDRGEIFFQRPISFKAPTKTSRHNHFSNIDLTYKPSKQHKLIYSYLRREVSRDKSIVVPLMSLPAALQINSHVTRLYDHPTDFRTLGIPQNKGLMAEVTGPPKSLDVYPVKEPKLSPKRPATTCLSIRGTGSPSPPQSPSPHRSPRSPPPVTRRQERAQQFSTRPTSRQVRPERPLSEYKLKMTSLTAANPETFASDSGQRRYFSTSARTPAATRPTALATRPRSRSVGNPYLLNANTAFDLLVELTPTKGQDHEENAQKQDSIDSYNQDLGEHFLQSVHTKSTESSQTNSKMSVKSSPRSASPVRIFSPKPRTLTGSYPSSHIQGNGKAVGTKAKRQSLPVKGTPNVAKHSSNEGLEGKTELTQTPGSLSLSVFLPRENAQDSLCNRKDIRNKPDAGQNVHQRSRHGQQTNSPISSVYLFDPRIMIRMSSAKLRHSEKTADEVDLSENTGSHPGSSGYPENGGEFSTQRDRSRFLHCEVFGPDLCSDCQLHQDRADVRTWQKAVHPDVSFDPKRLVAAPKLHRPVYPTTQVSLDTGSDVGDLSSEEQVYLPPTDLKHVVTQNEIRTRLSIKPET